MAEFNVTFINGTNNFFGDETARQVNDNENDIPWIYDLSRGDANWIMTSSFIIFTMQTGFGLLESGVVSVKNEVNIMMKNVVDIVLGGLTYWMFGFALSFGRSYYTNPFISFGDFFLSPRENDPLMGSIFAAFLFQLSFATTATTIVSGAMAERCNFKAYCLFSLLNTIVYCIPAKWVWDDNGFLKTLGAVDIAGSGPVHLVGGSSALASALMLGPRLGRYTNGIDPLPLGSPVNAVLGLFVLWWGWLAFNSGSTYGLSGSRWHYAARAAVMTMLASFGGGIWGLGQTLVTSNGEFVDIVILINAILGALVSVTAGCFLYGAFEAIAIGIIGGALACLTMPLLDRFGVDDPVGATSVHGVCGIWGTLSVGLFAGNPVPLDTTNGRSGVFRGGGWYLFGVQALSCLCLATWSFMVTVILLWIVNKIIPIRMEPRQELIGADLSEHKIRHKQAGVSRALSALRPVLSNEELHGITEIGHNPGHDAHLREYYSFSNNPHSYKLKHLLQSPPNLAIISEMENGRGFTNGHNNRAQTLSPVNLMDIPESKAPETKVQRNIFKNAASVITNMGKATNRTKNNSREYNNMNMNGNGNGNGNNNGTYTPKFAWTD